MCGESNFFYQMYVYFRRLRSISSMISWFTSSTERIAFFMVGAFIFLLVSLVKVKHR